MYNLRKGFRKEGNLVIYFDNAATTKYKPAKVIESFVDYVKNIGVSPGRGSYALGIEASRMLYKVRKKIGLYFGLNNSTNVVFTKNSTEAINLFFYGYLRTGDHVIITCYEHNSILRPLQALKDKGIIDYSIINREDLMLPADKLLDKYCRENTKIIAMTLASNLTGRIIFNKDLFAEAEKRNIVTFLDSSQGAGKIPLSMEEDKIDYLAFTGHKDLMGLPGVGGLCCKEKDKISPLIQGGTGIWGNEYVNPKIFPEGLEAGTLNMPAIWALGSAINYISEHIDEHRIRERNLINQLLEQLRKIESVIVYDNEFERVSTIGINIKGYTSDEVVRYLDSNGVCVRGGMHCAILAHEALGTVTTGVIRISLCPSNTEAEIEEFIELIKNVGEKR